MCVCARACECMCVSVSQSERQSEKEREERERVCTYSPLHYNQQTLSALIKVLVDIDDSHNVGTRWGPPVELHFPAGLGAVLQHLGERKKKETRQEVKRVWGIPRIMRLKRKGVNCKNEKEKKRTRTLKMNGQGCSDVVKHLPNFKANDLWTQTGRSHGRHYRLRQKNSAAPSWNICERRLVRSSRLLFDISAIYLSDRLLQDPSKKAPWCVTFSIDLLPCNGGGGNMFSAW